MKSDYKKILENSFNKYTKQHFYGRIYSLISFPFTVLLINLMFSPNFITSLSLALGIAGSLFYLKYSILTAIILFELSVILDYSDGSVAVFTKKTSKFGAWFDHIGDRVVLRFLIIGMAIGVFLRYNDIVILILGFIILAIKTLRDYNEVYVNSVSDYKETTQSMKNAFKSKFGYLSAIAEILLDLLAFILPFIVLFNFTIITYFFLVYLITELLRITADLFFTGKKFYSIK